MARAYLLDQHLAEVQPSEVLERALWAADAYDFYNLTPETAVIFGSCALDLYGVDCRHPRADGDRKSRSDLDVVVVREVVSRLEDDYPIGYSSDGLDIYAYERPTPNYRGGTDDWPIDALARFYRGRESYRVDFEIASENSQIISVPERAGSYAVLLPNTTLEWTRSGGAPKDILHVLYAHASAERQRLDFAATPEWRNTVRKAVATAMSRDFQRFELPDWILELLAEKHGVHAHPAFASLGDQA